MEVITKNTFAQEVLKGLSQYPKKLPSKYFYDEIGDKLFQDIMAMPEYYLTRSELEILEQNKKKRPSKKQFLGGFFMHFNLAFVFDSRS